MEVNPKLTLNNEDAMVEMNSYQKLISKLLYLSHTRPVISYSINVLSKFLHNP